MEVHILAQKLVKPSAPTPNNLRNYKLSFIDQLAPSSSVPWVFFYSTNDFMVENVKSRQRLEKSLSETLTLFYPFAGRFIKEDLVVDCNDNGVEYLEARVNGCVDEIIEGRMELGQLDCLVPLIGAADSYTTPLVAIQVNIFNCGGLAIAVRVPHKIADAPTGIAFINAWATANHKGVCEVIPPSFKLALAIPARPGRALIKPSPRMESGTVKLVTKRFVFDKNSISALKVKTTFPVDDTSGVIQSSPTRVEVVSAIIWRALINTARTKHGHFRASTIIHPVNLRGKTALPVANNTCGNFYVLAAARFTPDRSKMELHHLVALIRDAIRKPRKIYSDVELESDEFFGKVYDSFKELKEESEEIDVRMFTSWCKAPLYGVDFGWGKPSWVSGVSRREPNWVSLQDTKCGEGVEARITLDEQEMLHFQQDMNILAFGSDPAPLEFLRNSKI